MIIYKITNKINGKIYIGQTVNTINVRWDQHCNDKKGYCRLLSNAIKKYCRNNFTITIIARANNIDELNHREFYYINLFNSLAPNGYNLLSGGKNKRHSQESKIKMSNARKGEKNCMFGKTHTKEAREKISNAKKGKKFKLKTKRSPEILKKMSEVRLGKKLSEETKKKLSIAMSGKNHPNWGKKFSEETKRKQAEAKKGKFDGEKNPFFGKKHNEEAKLKIGNANRGRPSAHARKVILLELGKVFDSLTSAAKFCKENNKPTKVQTISKACKNENKLAAGYHWSFV